PGAVHSRVGRHEQTDAVSAALLSRQRDRIRQLQRHGKTVAVCGSGSRAHHHCVEMAG
ncbi:hypothetical protein M9458_023012, partial [Cirrhinus mrigala]